MDSTVGEKVVSPLVNGQLSCAVAFKIASELKLRSHDVEEAADNPGIRIINCQSGCFP